MTVIAVVAAGNMRWMLAGGCDAVVAGATCTQDLGVIDYCHWRKHACAMAVFADVRRKRVRLVFTGCIRAVMAVYAVSRDGRVVKNCG